MNMPEREVNMSRPRNGSNLSIAQLEKILEERRKELNQLTAERSQLHKRLEELEEQIRQLGGDGVSVEAPARAHNEKTLIETLQAILQEANQPMKVSAIVEKVKTTGYKSTSANFRGIVNQTLIKDKRFTPTARGFYTLKK